MKSKLKYELRKTFYKVFNKKQYKREKEIAFQEKKFRKIRTYNSQGYFEFNSEGKPATFVHSGQTGDIIYSLPTVRALSKSATLLFRLDAPAGLLHSFNHPYGDSRLTAQAVSMLKPLLESQDYIQAAKVVENTDTIDFDLDKFRLTPQDFGASSITHYYFPIFGVAPDISQPWLEVPANDQAKDYIILARSTRYRNETLDFSFLGEYKKVGFVGVKSEFIEMKSKIRGLEYFEVADFLQLASIIRSAKLFIGNQSFPFSLAEAMKTPRLLEQCPYAPNVIPVGGVGHPVLFQRQFTHLVSQLA